MVSSGIWDVAYFSFIAKLHLHIFCTCYIRTLAHGRHPPEWSDVDFDATDYSSNSDPSLFGNLAPGAPLPLSPINKHNLLHTSSFNQIQIKRMRTRPHNQPRDKTRIQIKGDLRKLYLLPLNIPKVRSHTFTHWRRGISSCVFRRL